MNRFAISWIIGLLCAAQVWAQPTMDGRLAGDEAFYGSAISIQNTRTRYGNATLGDPINGGGGSEIDQIFAKVAEGRLHVFVAGNLQSNFNKMEVFVDSVAGGVNRIVGPDLPVGVDGFCCGGLNSTSGALQRMNGLTFDNTDPGNDFPASANFEADYYLTFTNGNETVNPGLADPLTFWALTAHYADLTQGTNGAVVRAGMQLAYDGQPNVLRSPGDYNHDGSVGAADYTVWRDTLGATTTRGSGADANGSLIVDEADYTIWKTNHNKNTTLSGSSFTPSNLANGVSEALLGPALPGLSPGQLIDRNYALGAGGCTDNTGAGCVARELEFALDEDPSEIGTNQSSHRNFDNTIDLRVGFNNSNKEGVFNGANGITGPWELAPAPGVDNPETVTTGLEFSIPLAHIGNPTGDIKLTVFIGGGGHTDISNQFSGYGILDTKPGTAFYSVFPADPLGTLNSYEGDQFITISQSPGSGSLSAVPEPASVSLLFVALGAWCYAARRR